MWDLLQIEYTRGILDHLGYPHYLLIILGAWKLPCAGATLPTIHQHLETARALQMRLPLAAPAAPLTGSSAPAPSATGTHDRAAGSNAARDKATTRDLNREQLDKPGQQ